MYLQTTYVQLLKYFSSKIQSNGTLYMSFKLDTPQHNEENGSTFTHMNKLIFERKKQIFY